MIAALALPLAVLAKTLIALGVLVALPGAAITALGFLLGGVAEEYDAQSGDRE